MTRSLESDYCTLLSSIIQFSEFTRLDEGDICINLDIENEKLKISIVGPSDDTECVLECQDSIEHYCSATLSRMEVNIEKYWLQENVETQSDAHIEYFPTGITLIYIDGYIHALSNNNSLVCVGSCA